MRSILPVLLKDFYKAGHKHQYPDDLELVYSNITPRSSRMPGVDRVLSWSQQYFRDEFLIRQFNEGFFQQPRADVMKAYQRRMDYALGPGMDISHIGELHELGYLPLLIKAVPEGTLVPLRVPFTTIRNTDRKFGWLTNMLETLLSCSTWGPITSATTAFQYRRKFEEEALLTGASREFVKWQGHDFSMRGMFGVESSILSAAGHLLCFTGTDTIPAIDFHEMYYGANCEAEMIGGSVAATEHSVMCVGGQKGEKETIERLISVVYPRGIVSVVCDTWDFWGVLTDILPELREQILGRDGKVVIRPDSGDPVKIILGDPEAREGDPAHAGAIRILYNLFGGERNASGFIELDGHIGLIYGDSITLERQSQILGGLRAMGFASSNVVLGIGSYTYQHCTRDTLGQAIKATYAETTSGGPQAIFKTPKTDDGVKNSARGLLQVREVGGVISLVENVDWSHENGGFLQTIFHNGQVSNTTTLSEIRARVEAQL